jgi:hypothetical protein
VREYTTLCIALVYHIIAQLEYGFKAFSLKFQILLNPNSVTKQEKALNPYSNWAII